MKTYEYNWNTVEEIIKNKDKKIYFSGWGVTSLSKTLGATNEEYAKAHELWLKLKDAFNKEAKIYNEDIYSSKLGSVGEVTKREVLRSDWWDFLDEDAYGDYRTITRIIELLHDGEQLETGIIHFGS